MRGIHRALVHDEQVRCVGLRHETVMVEHERIIGAGDAGSVLPNIIAEGGVIAVFSRSLTVAFSVSDGRTASRAMRIARASA